MDEEPDHQGGHEVAMTVEEILKRGLVADPDWMKVRTVVLRVFYAKSLFSDHPWADYDGSGGPRYLPWGAHRHRRIRFWWVGSVLLYTGHSWTSPPYWQIQLCRNTRRRNVSVRPSALYDQSPLVPFESQQWWGFDLVPLFSDQVEDIVYAVSGSSKAKGLLTGIRKIRCFLWDGIERTDVPYDTEIMAYDGSRYRILVSVDGRKPRCLKCGKLGHIRRDCKAKKCAVCRNMTDEHVTANCPYKGTNGCPWQVWQISA